MASLKNTINAITSKLKIPLFLRPLSEWVTRYPFLLLIASVLVAVLFGVGLDLGLPYLFWHDDWRIQLLSGFAVASLLNELCFVGYLLDSDENWIKDSNEKPRSLNWYYVRTFLILGCIALSSFFFNTEGFNPPLRFFFVFGMVFGMIFFWLSVNWLSTHVPPLPGLNWISRRKELDSKDPQIVGLHRLSGLYFYFYTLMFLLLSVCFADSRLLSPAVGVCMLLGLVARSYGFILFYFERHYPGILLAAGILLLLFSLIPAKNHQFDGLSLESRIRLPDTPEQIANQGNLLDNEATLKQWSENFKNKKLVVVALSGGGIRAATWAVSVLTKLEEKIPEFPKHVRIINGASGGILGAAYYTAEFRERLKNGKSMSKTHRDEMITAISSDSLSPAVRYLVLRDLPLLPVASFPWKDRGQAIEDAWNKNTNGVLTKKFSDLKDFEQYGKIPSLIFSPMLVEDGRRLLISNLDLSHLLVRNSGPMIGSDSEKSYSISAMEFHRVFYPAGNQLKISTAARMSATFPYISPAGELPSSPARHLVDAGYYDNYGINVTALWMIRTVEQLKEYAPKGVVLIQIRDALEDIGRNQYKFRKESRPILPWLTTPIIALLNSQQATMSYRNDEALSELAKVLNEGNSKYFSLVNFEFSQTAALSWYLTKNEVNTLKTDMDSPAMLKQIEALRKTLAE